MGNKTCLSVSKVLKDEEAKEQMARFFSLAMVLPLFGALMSSVSARISSSVKTKSRMLDASDSIPQRPSTMLLTYNGSRSHRCLEFCPPSKFEGGHKVCKKDCEEKLDELLNANTRSFNQYQGNCLSGGVGKTRGCLAAFTMALLANANLTGSSGLFYNCSLYINNTENAEECENGMGLFDEILASSDVQGKHLEDGKNATAFRGANSSQYLGSPPISFEMCVVKCRSNSTKPWQCKIGCQLGLLRSAAQDETDGNFSLYPKTANETLMVYYKKDDFQCSRFCPWKQARRMNCTAACEDVIANFTAGSERRLEKVQECFDKWKRKSWKRGCLSAATSVLLANVNLTNSSSTNSTLYECSSYANTACLDMCAEGMEFFEEIQAFEEAVIGGTELRQGEDAKNYTNGTQFFKNPRNVFDTCERECRGSTYISKQWCCVLGCQVQLLKNAIVENTDGSFDLFPTRITSDGMYLAEYNYYPGIGMYP